MREVFLIGDSHVDAIQAAFSARGWTAHGGALQMGRLFEEPFFEVFDGRVVFNDDFAQANFARALTKARVSHLGGLPMPVVTTMGFNSNRLAKRLSIAHEEQTAIEPPRWSSAVVEAVVRSVRAHVLEFYRHLPQGQTFAVLSPQRAPLELIPTIRQIEEILVRLLLPLGVRIVDVRGATTDAQGLLRSEYWRQTKMDQVHANETYGDVVVQNILTALEAPCQSPNINAHAAS